MDTVCASCAPFTAFTSACRKKPYRSSQNISAYFNVENRGMRWGELKEPYRGCCSEEKRHKANLHEVSRERALNESKEQR